MKLLIAALATLVALTGACTATTYTVSVKTADISYAGSDRLHLNATLYGNAGKVNLGVLDSGWNDFEQGNTDVFEVESEEFFINFNCIRLVVTGTDAWLFDFISVSSNISPKERLFNNSNAIWMSGDATEGNQNLTLCIKPVLYTMTTETSDEYFSGSDSIDLDAVLLGDAGVVKFERVTSFEKGIQEFHVMSDTDIGEIQCLKLNAGGDDAWLFSSIEIAVNRADPWKIINDSSTWMSGDQDEGDPEMEFCRA